MRRAEYYFTRVIYHLSAIIFFVGIIFIFTRHDKHSFPGMQSSAFIVSSMAEFASTVEASVSLAAVCRSILLFIFVLYFVPVCGNGMRVLCVCDELEISADAPGRKASTACMELERSPSIGSSSVSTKKDCSASSTTAGRRKHSLAMSVRKREDTNTGGPR